MAAAADVMVSKVVMLLYVLTEKELNGKPEAKKMTSCHTFGCFPWRPDKSSGEKQAGWEMDKLIIMAHQTYSIIPTHPRARQPLAWLLLLCGLVY